MMLGRTGVALRRESGRRKEQEGAARIADDLNREEERHGSFCRCLRKGPRLKL
jgi:hypothetical protein